MARQDTQIIYREWKWRHQGGKVSEMLKSSWDNCGTSMQWLLCIPYCIYVWSCCKNSTPAILDLLIWHAVCQHWCQGHLHDPAHLDSKNVRSPRSNTQTSRHLKKQKEFDFQLNSAGPAWAQNDLFRHTRHIKPGMALPYSCPACLGWPWLGLRCSSSRHRWDEMGDEFRDAWGQILGKSFQ